MKTKQLIRLITLAFCSIVILTACTDEKIVTEEIEIAAATFTITGVVSYPEGTASSATVNLIGDVTSNTLADANGIYSFTNLLPGSYSVYANYNTENPNAGRYDGLMFLGTNIPVVIVDANMTQDIALTTTVSSGVAVNTSASGIWVVDPVHTEVVFAFPFDNSTSEFSGRFNSYDVEVIIDDADLTASSITASVDLLSANTGQPGRDGYWTDGSSVDGVDSLDVSGNPVTWFNGGCLDTSLGATTGSNFTTQVISNKSTATWTSVSIEHFGDGYVAHGLFTLNTGIDVPSDLYFKYLPGYIKGTAPAQTRIASFEGKFRFAAKAEFEVIASHILDADVDVYISTQVSTPL